MHQTPSSKKPLLAIVGQTAVGKTALSLALAQQFQGEIVSSDSRLFYRGMDIGTAKPSPAEQAIVPHHFIDICDLDETLTLGEYQEKAYRVIDDCHQRGKLPMLVGGTGQYFKAVVEGWGIPRVPPQPDLRAALEKIDRLELARWLAVLDPQAAVAIHPHNTRRIVRALEVTFVKGIPISTLQAKSPPPYDMFVIGLDRDRADLYRRIDGRVDQMMKAGLLDEVQALLDQGYNWQTPAMSGLGYRQFQPYLDGVCRLADAVEKIKTETHRFARQQNTWFRRDDERIHWFAADTADLIHQVERHVQAWLAEKTS